MQREIKFRTWTGEKMISPDYVRRDGYAFWRENSIPQMTKENIMQYTGLKDKNGKEIYEGDVIDIHQTVNGQSIFVIENCVPFPDVRYAFDKSYKYEYNLHELLEIDIDESEKTIEVIGNIYENPELLNQ